MSWRAHSTAVNRRTVELRTTAIAPSGDAVGRDDAGRVIFVRHALPDEVVLAEVTSDKDGYTHAITVRVLESSPHRQPAPCPEIPKGCGGCPWQDVAMSEQRRLKETMIVDALDRNGMSGPPMRSTVELPGWAHRTTVRAGVHDGRAGYHRSRSKEIVAVEGCATAHPLIAELVVDGRYPGADSVLLRCGARTGERMAAPAPRTTAAATPEGTRTNDVHEVAAGRLWRISASSFFQTRPDGVDALAELVTEAAGDLEPSTAVDLYGGVGLFAGVLADRGWSVTSVEGQASAAKDAVFNLADLDVKCTKADVHRGRASPADLVVADPSRDGLKGQGVRAVVATGASRVVLVSCDARSLGRDGRRLREAGYQLTSVTPVDLFPHTFHVEVVAVFDR
jgi:23S rRNA (uracil1939-C5)-methyltransferase